MAPADYLFVFAQAHNEFRVPELQSIAELYGFHIGFDHYPAGDLANAVRRPCMILKLEQEEHAERLAHRCVLIKSIYELYAQGSSYEELHEANKRARRLWERYVPNTSFKFTVTGYNHGLSQRRQRNVIESFSYMDFLGKIEMKNPEVTLGVFEEYEDDRRPDGTRNADGEFKQAYLGRLVAQGTARALVRTFDVKKRAYFGNTSMEAEISLLMANQTQAAPGKLIYDPFVGTGSMAYTTAFFGAYVYGSDIDGRQMRGKSWGISNLTRFLTDVNFKAAKTPGVIRQADRYGVAQRIMDLCTFDVTHHPWRCGGLFDAIVTDPPYGIRAGAKRLGRKKPREDKPPQLPQSNPNEPYIPPTKPYEFSVLVSDLILFARYQLKPRGLLVFFLPTVTDMYGEVDIQAALCEGMELVANSVQGFGNWGRRLITVRKSTIRSYPPPTFDSSDIDGVKGSHVPAHKDFREKYFQGFKKASE